MPYMYALYALLVCMWMDARSKLNTKMAQTDPPTCKKATFSMFVVCVCVCVVCVRVRVCIHVKGTTVAGKAVEKPRLGGQSPMGPR